MLLAAVHELLECYPTVPTVQMSGVADNHNLHSSGMVVAQCKLSHCNRSPPSTEPTMSLARSRTLLCGCVTKTVVCARYHMFGAELGGSCLFNLLYAH
jgi:hypothetical protein